MKRLLRLRLSALLIGLAAVPIAAFPFAESIRAEWKRYWEPKPAVASQVTCFGFAEVTFTVCELDVVEEYEEPVGCEFTIACDSVATREKLDFVESLDFETAMVSIDVDLSPPVDSSRRLLEVIAEHRCVLTGPADFARGQMTERCEEEGERSRSVEP